MILRIIQQILKDESGSITAELGLIISTCAVAATAALDSRSFELEETFLRVGENIVALVTYLKA